jgi:hypothetical protein
VTKCREWRELVDEANGGGRRERGGGGRVRGWRKLSGEEVSEEVYIVVKVKVDGGGREEVGSGKVHIATEREI